MSPKIKWHVISSLCFFYLSKMDLQYIFRIHILNELQIVSSRLGLYEKIIAQNNPSVRGNVG